SADGWQAGSPPARPPLTSVPLLRTDLAPAPASSPSATWCNEGRFASWRPPPRHRRRAECLYGAWRVASLLRAVGRGRRRPLHFDEGLPGATRGEPSPRSVCG